MGYAECARGSDWRTVPCAVRRWLCENRCLDRRRPDVVHIKFVLCSLALPVQNVSCDTMRMWRKTSVFSSPGVFLTRSGGAAAAAAPATGRAHLSPRECGRPQERQSGRLLHRRNIESRPPVLVFGVTVLNFSINENGAILIFLAARVT